jgi:hypothetical protein
LHRIVQPSPPPRDVERSAARQEWRRLCYVLEGLQATALLQRTVDKYAMARAYLVFGNEITDVVADIARAIRSEDYRFFTGRGVASSLMTPAFARELLQTWQGAIASKQARIAEAFQQRFGEDIGEFLGMPRNAAAIAAATSHDEGNAVRLLERWLGTAVDGVAARDEST